MFVAFCFVASGLYCLNDYSDRDADKLHPEKCNRPVASGAVSAGLASRYFYSLRHRASYRIWIY
ncbi:MAG: UbiA family prenyltransferase [Candidatus Latescibacterota bacterium]